MAKDPVCGMEVAEKKAAAQSVYQRTTYYFCNTGCKTAFDKDPVKYVAKKEGSHGPSSTEGAQEHTLAVWEHARGRAPE